MEEVKNIKWNNKLYYGFPFRRFVRFYCCNFIGFLSFPLTIFVLIVGMYPFVFAESLSIYDKPDNITSLERLVLNLNNVCFQKEDKKDKIDILVIDKDSVKPSHHLLLIDRTLSTGDFKKADSIRFAKFGGIKVDVNTNIHSLEKVDIKSLFVNEYIQGILECKETKSICIVFYDGEMDEKDINPPLNFLIHGKNGNKWFPIGTKEEKDFFWNTLKNQNLYNIKVRKHSTDLRQLFKAIAASDKKDVAVSIISDFHHEYADPVSIHDIRDMQKTGFCPEQFNIIHLPLNPAARKESDKLVNQLRENIEGAQNFVLINTDEYAQNYFIKHADVKLDVQLCYNLREISEADNRVHIYYPVSNNKKHSKANFSFTFNQAVNNDSTVYWRIKHPHLQDQPIYHLGVINHVNRDYRTNLVNDGSWHTALSNDTLNVELTMQTHIPSHNLQIEMINGGYAKTYTIKFIEVLPDHIFKLFINSIWVFILCILVYFILSILDFSFECYTILKKRDYLAERVKKTRLRKEKEEYRKEELFVDKFLKKYIHHNKSKAVTVFISILLLSYFYYYFGEILSKTRSINEILIFLLLIFMVILLVNGGFNKLKSLDKQGKIYKLFLSCSEFLKIIVILGTTFGIVYLYTTSFCQKHIIHMLTSANIYKLVLGLLIILECIYVIAIIRTKKIYIEKIHEKK